MGFGDLRTSVSRFPARATNGRCGMLFETIWSRPVVGTNLVIAYLVTAQVVDVLGVRPAWKEVR